MRARNHTNFAASLRECAELGSPVDLSMAESVDEPIDVEIEQVGGVHESTVFDLPSGLAGCTLDVIITNYTSNTIYCREVELRLRRWNYLFTWLPDPSEAGKIEYYCFPGGRGPEYDRDIVINHRLLNDGALTGRPLSGLLLATR